MRTLLGDGYNWYGYYGGNPVNYYDFTGSGVSITGYDGSIGLGLTFSGGLYYVFDDNGNSGILLSGEFGGGIAMDKGITTLYFPEMNDISELEGAGASADCIVVHWAYSNCHNGVGVSYPVARFQVSFTVSKILIFYRRSKNE